MNNKAFKMLTLAALGSMSAAAMAITVTAPRPTIHVEAPVIARPTISAKPGAVAAPKAALPGTQTLQDAQQASAVAPTCDPRAMYAGLSADTDVTPDEVQSFVNDGIIQVAGNNCGADTLKYGSTARNVWLKTAKCAQIKGIKGLLESRDRAILLGSCEASAKRELNVGQPTDEEETANVYKIAKECGLYNLNVQTASAH